MKSLIAEALKNDNQSFGDRACSFCLGFFFDPINWLGERLEEMGVDNPSVDWENEINNPSSAGNSYP